MSDGTYETSSIPHAPAFGNPRRVSGGIPLPYDVSSPLTPGKSLRIDRPFEQMPHRLAPSRRSPSPVHSRRYTPYNSHHSPRDAPSYHDDYPAGSSYRPNSYRPSRATSYYEPSPSPDRYEANRSHDGDPYDRSSPWHAPASSSWPDRRPAPLSSPTSWQRPRNDTLATPMFEPSDSWKQTHADRSFRPDTFRPSISDKYVDPRPRDPRDSPPERSRGRSDILTPYFPGGDRYRPSYFDYSHRDSYHVPRSNTYRPAYDDDPPPRPSRTPFDRQRRDSSASLVHSTHHSDRRLPSPDRSTRTRSPTRSRSRSPVSLREHLSISIPQHQSPGVTPRWHRTPPHDEEPPRKRFKSRSTSRDSIASTHVSDTQATKTDSRNNQTYSPGAAQDAYPTPASVPSSESAFKDSESNNSRPPSVPSMSKPSTHPLENPLLLPQIDNTSSSSMLKGHSNQTAQSHSLSALAFENVSPNGSNSEVSVPSVLQNASRSSHGWNGDSIATINLVKKQETEHSSTVIETSSTLPTSKDPRCSTTRDSRLNATGDPPGISQISLPETQAHLKDEDKPSTSISNRPAPMTQAGSGAAAHHTLAGGGSATSPDDDIPNEKSALSELSILNMSDAKSIREALRVVVMTRLRCDHQTREERISPVLMANLSLVESGPSTDSTSPEDLIREVMEGPRAQKRADIFSSIQPTLITHFGERKAALSAKIRRLRDEYLSLHEQWLIHCSQIDGISKPGPVDEPVLPPGRATRRSTASLGDAVRSDLEMEQIIASLGNDELTDPNHLSQRNLAVIPDMISVTHGQVDYLFDETNHLVDNPSEYYGPHTGIHDWTEVEKDTFLEKFACWPKQFGIIADYMPEKTAAQCIDFYYLHKKGHIDFRKVVTEFAPNKRKRGNRRADKQKGNGLLADIRQHDAEVHRDSASPALNGPRTRRKRAIAAAPPEPRKPAPSRKTVAHLEATPTSTPTPEPEARQRRRRVIAPRAATLAVPDEGDDDCTDAEAKLAKKGRKTRKPRTPITEATLEGSPSAAGESKVLDQSQSNTRRKPALNTGSWSDDDADLFLKLLSQHGADFKRVSASMPNKTTIQVSNFYKSNLLQLDLETVAAGAPQRSPTPEMARETWKETAQFPGSGIMSPIADSTIEIGDTAATPFLNSEHSPPIGVVDSSAPLMANGAEGQGPLVTASPRVGKPEMEDSGIMPQSQPRSSMSTEVPDRAHANGTPTSGPQTLESQIPAHSMQVNGIRRRVPGSRGENPYPVVPPITTPLEPGTYPQLEFFPTPIGQPHWNTFTGAPSSFDADHTAIPNLSPSIPHPLHQSSRPA